jgi:hypothetical protein
MIRIARMKGRTACQAEVRTPIPASGGIEDVLLETATATAPQDEGNGRSFLSLQLPLPFNQTFKSLLGVSSPTRRREPMPFHSLNPHHPMSLCHRCPS